MMFRNTLKNVFVVDLYGLLNYLHIEPYSEEDTWEHLLYLPYMHGEVDHMHKFLAKVLWRSAKSDVIGQV